MRNLSPELEQQIVSLSRQEQQRPKPGQREPEKLFTEEQESALSAVDMIPAVGSIVGWLRNLFRRRREDPHTMQMYQDAQRNLRAVLISERNNALALADRIDHVLGVLK